jgi:hypothetical protein
MDIKETLKILSTIKSIYPSKEEDVELTAKVWQLLFAKDPLDAVLPAVMECLSTMHYEPKPADIKARMYRDKNAVPAIALWEQARNFWRYELTDDLDEDKRRYEMLAPEIKAVYSLSEMKEMRSLNASDVTRFEQPRFIKRVSEVRAEQHETLQIEGGSNLVRIDRP